MTEEQLKLTPRDIAKASSWEEVAKALTYYYDKKWLQLKPVFEHIQKIGKQKPKDPEEYIEVVVGGFVSLKKNDLNDRFYAIHTNKFSLSFRKWRETANIPFDETTLRRYTFAELIAHYLYEITWYGNEKDMMKTSKKITGRFNDFKKSKNGKGTRV